MSAVRRPAGHDRPPIVPFIEAFAENLTQAGMPRMASRAFAAVLSSDSGSATAAELATQLKASPAAISGAVGYLVRVGLVVRVRELGQRYDRYRIEDDMWYQSFAQRDEQLMRWAQSLRKGIRAVGPSSPAGARLKDTLEFFEFVAAELPLMLARWRARGGK